MGGSERIAVADDASRAGWVRLALRGRVTVADAADLYDAAAAVAARDVNVGVGCEAAEYLDVAVLQVLIALGRDQVRRGKQFDLAGVPDALGRVLCAAGLGNRS